MKLKMTLMALATYLFALSACTGSPSTWPDNDGAATGPRPVSEGLLDRSPRTDCTINWFSSGQLPQCH